MEINKHFIISNETPLFTEIHRQITVPCPLYWYIFLKLPQQCVERMHECALRAQLLRCLSNYRMRYSRPYKSSRLTCVRLAWTYVFHASIASLPYISHVGRMPFWAPKNASHTCRMSVWCSSAMHHLHTHLRNFWGRRDRRFPRFRGGRKLSKFVRWVVTRALGLVWLK